MSGAGGQPPDANAPQLGTNPRAHFDPLNELAGNATTVLVNSALVLMAALPRVWNEVVSIDVAGLARAPTTPLTTRLNRLSRQFLSYVFDTGRTAAARHRLTQAMQEAEQASRALARATHFELRSISESDTRSALEQADEFLRVAGLARHERFCRLREVGGVGGVLWYAVPAEAVTAALVNKLFRRVDFFAQRNRLGELERNAALWYFDNHAVPPEDTEMKHRQLFRKGEWCLVERRSLAFRASFLDAFISHNGLQHLDAREQQLARALQRRVLGVFEVKRALDDSATLHDLLTGSDFEVRGHNFPLQHGHLAFGSLLPFESAWQFSPGCAVFNPPRPNLASRILAAFPDSIPAGLRIELMLGAASTKVDTIPPHDLPPFASAAEARAAEKQMLGALLDAGYARAPAGWEALRDEDGTIAAEFEPIVVTDPELFASLDPSDRPDRVDAAVTEWLAATRKMIRESEGGSRRPAARDPRAPGSGGRDERS